LIEKEALTRHKGSLTLSTLLSLPPQNENTVFHPRSPYAVAKVFSFHITQLYREAYGIFACNGILFNHESPTRGKQFVTRKISHSVAKIKLGYQESFALGNLNSKRLRNTIKCF